MRSAPSIDRRLAQAPGDPAYGDAATRAIDLMARNLAAGAPAARAAVVGRVLKSRRPPRRVSAGKAGRRAGLMAKRLLPFRVFEAAAKRSLESDGRTAASRRRRLVFPGSSPWSRRDRVSTATPASRANS